MNPITDYQLAHEADDREIEKTFRELPWLVTLYVNGGTITRKEWKQIQEEKKERK